MEAVTIDTFGGLDLLDDPPESKGAIDLLNVDLDQRGRIRTRSGYTRFSTSAAKTYLKLLPAFPPPAAKPFLLLYLEAGTYKLNMVATDGTVSSVGNLTSATVTGTTAIGTPGASSLYVASGGQTLKQVTALFAVSSSVGKPYYVATTPWDNRLVQARYDAAGDDPGTNATGDPSLVCFSDEGDPNTYSLNSYEYLNPGDGEAISGVATWREYVFVFKRSKAFLFTAPSTSTTGEAIFNHRPVAVPQRIRPMSDASNACVAGSDGVYFAAADGIYMTSGGPAARISDPVEPLFTGAGSPPVVIDTLQGLDWVGERLYVRFTAVDTHAYTLVFDRTTGAWMLWRDGSLGYAEWPSATGSQRPQVYALIGGYVVLQSLSATTDDGAVIASRYQAGWNDLGSPADKRVREIALWGTGTPTLSLYCDRSSTDTLAAAVTLGTSPAVTRGVQPKSRTGREFSWGVSSTSGAWNVSAVELLVADQRGL